MLFSIVTSKTAIGHFCLLLSKRISKREQIAFVRRCRPVEHIFISHEQRLYALTRFEREPIRRTGAKRYPLCRHVFGKARAAPFSKPFLGLVWRKEEP